MFSNDNSQRPDSPDEEWELSDLIHLITSEVEVAKDKLWVRSHNRRLMMYVKQLNLDLQVTVRHDSQGKLLFRTASQWQSNVSSLKLEFGYLLDTQAQEIRKSEVIDKKELRPLELLSDIHQSDIETLNTFSINSIAELERATQTSSMLTELSQVTGIDEARIRAWRQWPYISTVQPEQGPPGSIVVINGGKFNTSQIETGKIRVLFQNQPLVIKKDLFTETRLTVEVPKNATGTGVLIVEVNGEATNAKTWTVELSDLAVEDIILNPSKPWKPGTIAFWAKVANQGKGDAEAFNIQWELTLPDKSTPKLQEQGCPKLTAGQDIVTEQIKFECQQSGTYTIKCTADPDGKIPDCSRTNQTFVKEFVIPPSISEERRE